MVKNTSVDEHFFKLAEESLYTELSFVLKKGKEEINDIIRKKIEVSSISDTYL